MPEITPVEAAKCKEAYDLLAPILLRDYFAAHALVALAPTDAPWTKIAEGCYVAADAMLAARSKPLDAPA